jgi:hypothetical protein
MVERLAISEASTMKKGVVRRSVVPENPADEKGYLCEYPDKAGNPDRDCHS